MNENVLDKINKQVGILFTAEYQERLAKERKETTKARYLMYCAKKAKTRKKNYKRYLNIILAS